MVLPSGPCRRACRLQRHHQQPAHALVLRGRGLSRYRRLSVHVAVCSRALAAAGLHLPHQVLPPVQRPQLQQCDGQYVRARAYIHGFVRSSCSSAVSATRRLRSACGAVKGRAERLGQQSACACSTCSLSRATAEYYGKGGGGGQRCTHALFRSHMSPNQLLPLGLLFMRFNSSCSVAVSLALTSTQLLQSTAPVAPHSVCVHSTGCNLSMCRPPHSESLAAATTIIKHFYMTQNPN